MGKSAYGLTYADWEQSFQGEGFSLDVLPFWIKGLYKDQTWWDQHLAASMREYLLNSFSFNLPTISRTQEATDGTVKFQLRLGDGKEVETVLLPFHKRYTVCLSTQVGCGMNCSFCYTGTQGLTRHLTAGEIVGQYLVARNWLNQKIANSPKPSIVFMGQGEPLHNCDAVEQAIKVLNDTKLIGVGHRQMTLSTVGYLPNLERLIHFPRVNIALSLHSPFEHERSQLIPANARWPLAEVLAKLDLIPLLARQFITFEYLMVKDFNMTEAHADELQKMLGQRRALVNLIPMNPFPGAKWQRPSLEEIETFRKLLVERKLRVMVRTTKGDDILAACGQLKVADMVRSYAR